MRKKALFALAINQIIFFYLAVWLMYSTEQAVQAQENPDLFLGEIYYGQEDVWQIFDHEFPGNANDNNFVMHFNGVPYLPDANNNFPSGFGYDSHVGIDYSIVYEPVLAAADGIIEQAGWQNSANHRDGLGLYVRMRHTANQNYTTSYGHLSTLVVETGDDITIDAENPGHRSRILGIGGNTGNVFGADANCGRIEVDGATCGQHLHFEVRLNGVVVNPYGWVGAENDPWATHGNGAISHNLWITDTRPALVNAADQYPGAGDTGLTAEVPSDVHIELDNNDSARFTTVGTCWNSHNAQDGINGSFLTAPANIDPPSLLDADSFPGCYAEWRVDPGGFAHAPAGEYDAYVHIPDLATSLSATYTIVHTGQTKTAIVVQAAYPNEAHGRWAYIGRYDFTMDQTEYIRLSNTTIDDDSGNTIVADAIRLVAVNPPTFPPPAGTNAKFWLANYNAHQAMAADLFHQTVVQPGNSFGSPVRAVSASRSSANIAYYLLDNNEIWYTTNGGQSFSQTNFDSSGYDATDVFVSYSNPLELWVVVNNGDGSTNCNDTTAWTRLYHSANGGNSWSWSRIQDPEAYCIRSVNRGAVHPTNSQILYVGGRGEGQNGKYDAIIYRSLDGGANWERNWSHDWANGPNNSSRTTSIVTPTRGRNAGSVWYAGIWGNGGLSPQELHGVIRNQGSGWVYKAIENCDGCPTATSVVRVIDLAVDAWDEQLVLALVDGWGIFRSTNGGETWSQVISNNAVNTDWRIKADPTFHNTFWLTGRNVNDNKGSGLFYSEDGGQTWQRAFTESVLYLGGGTAYGRTALAISPLSITQDDEVTTPEGTAKIIDVLANDSDPNNLNIESVTQPENGQVGVSEEDIPESGYYLATNYSRITYTPNSGFIGVDYFTYTVSDADGRENTAVVTVIVGACSSPQANFSASPTNGESPLIVQFTNESICLPTTFTWDFGDSSPLSNEQNPVHTYDTAGSYTVSLTVSNASGSDTATQLITVQEPPTLPVANFTADLTSGFAPLTVTFTDESSGSPTSWEWNFGDSTAVSNEQNPVHTYTQPGSYTVSLTVSNANGSDMTTKTNYIAVGIPETPTPPPGGTYTFTAVADAYVKTGSGTNYGGDTELRLRDGSPDYDSYLKFDITGLSSGVSNAMVRLYTTGSGSDGGTIYLVDNNWAEDTITINNAPPLPSAPLNSAVGVAVGQWLEFDVTNAITGNGTVSFAISTSSTNSDFYSSREGSNPSQLVVTEGTPPPVTLVAAFAANPTTGTAPLSVTFTDESSGNPTSWAWDFGNGNSSNEQVPPAQIYSTPGSYTVSLTVSNANGNDTEVKTNYIIVQDTGTETPTPTPPPSGTHTFIAVADAYVKSGSGSNYGGDTELRLRDGSPDYDSYLKFDVSGVDSSVGNAILRLYTTGAGSDGGTVYLVNNNWVEDTITINNAPPLSATPLNSAVGVAVGQWLEFDVTSAVTGNGTVSFAISTSSSNSDFYSSREGSNPPQLIVTEGTPPSPTPTPSSTPSPTPSSTPTPTATPTATADPNLFTPVADAYVKVGSTTTYGTSDSTQMRLRYGGPDYNAYLQFAVTGVSKQVTQATLRLYATSSNSSDAGRLYQVDNNWTEAGIHGNNAPPLISALVDGVGSTSANQWVEFDVSDIVMGNGSFSFGLTTTSSSSHYYSTKEGSHAPQLVLTLNNNSVTSPTADFSATPLTGTPPLTVAFSDQTTGQPTSWLWEFGDGTTATVRHPVHTYANAGTYTVKLTVGNAAGSNSKTRTSYITVTTPPPTEFKLTPADGMAGDSFGNAVALSGETAVIGAAWKDQNGANTGVAYVFRQNGSSWLEQAKLIPGDGAENDYFGWDVDINGDVIVVGAPFFSSSTANTRPGAAYIFRKQQGIWVQETKLLASDGSNNNHFGTDVAISGNRVLVGSYQDDAQGIDAGAAYVFYWNGYGWVEEAKLVASDAQATDFFGSSVSLDNDTALIGANGDDDKGDWAGAAYVFQRSGSGWVEKAKLKANDGQANDYFGLSVALVNDLALIGANGEDAQGSNAGAAYLFRGSGANWTQEAKLVANNGGANDYFGTSVTVAENIAIIGSPQHNSANTDSGNVYVFEKNGAAWVESWQLLASDIAAGDQFGYSVAISANNILIGAWEDDDNGNYSGSAYVYTFQ